MKFNIYGIDLGLYVDSSISDTIVPYPTPKNNAGLDILSIISGRHVTIDYKGKEYRGISFTATVTIPGTEITGIGLPVVAVEKQSPDIVGISPNFDGVFGIGYPSLSKRRPQITVLDSLYNGGTIPNNEIGIQLCPYGMTSNSFINIGNTDVTAKCGTDGTSVAWVNSPTTDRHTVNIRIILVDDEQVELPERFQQVVENGRTLYSYIHTCFVYMRFPEVVVTALVDAILDSGAITAKNSMLKRKLSPEDIDNIFWKHYPMPKSSFNIEWNKLPSLTIVMYSETPVTDDNRNSVVAIKLGPKDYLKRIDSKNYLFSVEVGPSDNAILGIPFMNRLIVTFDLQNARIGFGPGCGCEVMADGYPIISNGHEVLWSPSQLPEQPSTSSSDLTSTLRRSLSQLGNTLRGSKHSKATHKKA
ncbi:hypothetical protein QVD99_003259 [Batrachochytrium dendrobatidis]|nr:hypothetical protein QVD99_003259 [Batrachochytrium dendrobatidis]OAJ42416.1 hypothetical protein BDEG_25867 [Batrachochytrium dendrobatidis JEL423]